MTRATGEAFGRANRPRLSILHRYLVREVIGPTALAFALYTFVMLMNQFFLIADYAYRFQVPASNLGMLFLLQFPHVIVLTLPIALLVGLLVATARMAADSELTAMSASGLSIGALLTPVLALSLAFTLATAWLSFDLMPRGNHRFTRELFRIFRENLLSNIRPREFNARLMPGYSFFVRELNRGPEGDVWRGILLEAMEADGHGRREFYVAGEAIPRVDEQAGAMLLTLRDVTVHTMSPTDPLAYDVRTLSEYSKVLPPPPLFRRPDETGSKGQREMTVPELLRARSEAAGSTGVMGRLLDVEIHKRFAIPAACLVFAFFGLGLGATARRSGRSFAFLVSLVVILVYYQLFYSGERLANYGAVPPWLAMWAGNLLFGVIGLGVFLERATEARVLTRVGRRLGDLDLGGRLRRSRLWRRWSEGSASREQVRARRTGIPGLLDRYILVTFARILLLVAASAVLLYVQVTLSQILNDIVRNHIGLGTVVQLYLAWLPEILSYVLPISVLVATVVTYSLLTRTNEITAMMVNGVSLYRVVTPVLAAGVLLSLLSFGFYGSWAAQAAMRKDEISATIEGRTFRHRLSALTWAESSDGRGFYHFDAYEPDRGIFHRLSFLEMDADGAAPVRHVYATRAAWEGAELRLERGWERNFQGARELTYRPFGQMRLPFVESRRDFGREWGEVRHLTSQDLEDYIRYRRRHGLPVRDLEIEQASRRAMPTLPLVMMLLGMPFAFAIGKRGSLYGIGVAIVLAIVYWSALVFAAYLGKLGVLPPALAAWSPSLFFATLGLAAFLNLRT